MIEDSHRLPAVGVAAVVAMSGVACSAPPTESLAALDGRLVSASQGDTVLPDGRCAGTPLRLTAPAVLALFTAKADGSFALDLTLPATACGAHLQALDGVTCRPSNVVALP